MVIVKCSSTKSPGQRPASNAGPVAAPGQCYHETAWETVHIPQDQAWVLGTLRPVAALQLRKVVEDSRVPTLQFLVGVAVPKPAQGCKHGNLSAIRNVHQRTQLPRTCSAWQTWIDRCPDVSTAPLSLWTCHRFSLLPKVPTPSRTRGEHSPGVGQKTGPRGIHFVAARPARTATKPLAASRWPGQAL